MDMFENQLNTTIEYLDSIKYDSFTALYYIDLLKNPKFQQLIQSLLEDSSIENKEKVYSDALAMKWRIVDLTYVLSIWGKSVETPEDLIEDFYFDSDDSFIPFSEEESNDKGLVEVEEATKTVNEPKLYHFGFYYEVSESVGQEPIYRGVLRSNIFNLSALIPEINKDINILYTC